MESTNWIHYVFVGRRGRIDPFRVGFVRMTTAVALPLLLVCETGTIVENATSCI